MEIRISHFVSPDVHLGEKMDEWTKVIVWSGVGGGMRDRDMLCLRLSLERDMAWGDISMPVMSKVGKGDGGDVRCW